MENRESLKIGELAGLTGVTTQTIRFYEREGLLPAPRRSANGYREYGGEAAGEISFIRECLDAGFTLRDVKRLKGLDADSAGSCAGMRDLLRKKIEGINERISSLKRVRAQLTGLEKSCSGRPPGDPCPTLRELHS